MSNEIKNQIDVLPLTALQYGVIAVCILMNLFDGMDVMVISYAAPSIAKDWSITPEALGVVFSSGLVGMTIGAFFLAPYADTIGRKWLMLIAAFLMTSGIYLTMYAGSIGTLLLLRFISGAGIGSMLACTAALTSEYTPMKSKNFWVSFVVSGFPIGAVLAGAVAGQIIPEKGWRSIFEFAGITTAFALPAIYFFLSESLEYYLKSQPARALEKANVILKKMRLAELTELPSKDTKLTALPISRLMTDKYRLPTLQLWIILFMVFASMYFMLSWIPKLSSNTGLSVKLSIYAGALFNVGAWFGIVTQGYFSSKFGLKKTIGFFLVATAILMSLFTLFRGNDFLLLLILALLGFGVQGGFVGLYTVAARMYPTEFRTTGVGYSIGSGRLGGIIGPIIGGVLVGLGLSMTTNFLVFSVPTLISGILTFYLSSTDID